MANLFNTAGDVGYRATGKIVKKMLKTGNYKLCAGRFGSPWTITKNNNVSAHWRRYDDLPPATAPVSEGVTPPAVPITSEDITATLAQYASWVPMTDVLWDTHEDAIPDEMVGKCGKQMGETLEIVTIATLKSDSTVFYANNAGSRGNLNSPVLPGDFKRIERYLSNHKAEMITKMVKASQKVSTEPIDDSYIVFGHTDLKADFEGMEGWTPVRNYADGGKKIHPAEVGSVNGTFRVLLTPLFSPWLSSGASSTTYLSGGNIVSVAAASDVYPVIVVAEDAYGVVRLQGFEAVEPAVVKPKPVHGDPIGQNGFVSWKTWFTSVVLNSNWLVRYEVCATAEP